MTATEVLVPKRGVHLRIWVTATLVLAVPVALLRILGVSESQGAQTFALVFTAIVAEALPFVLLGALAAALLEVYVPDRVFDRIAHLPVALQLPAAAMGGFAFPVCECGSVPVARRLIAKGMHPSAGLAFMFASPIFNPIVLGSTWVAYEARGLGLKMVLGRAGLGLILAIVAGWAIGTKGASDLLRPPSDHRGHDHDPSCRSSKQESFVSHLIDDFFYMGKFLILGAALAATMQAVIPQSLINGAASSPVIASLVLMGVAFISSLCSEADAFVAVSFAPFPIGSQLAFLVFGPILDFKLFFLYGGTFRGLVGPLAVVAIPVTFAGALWFEVAMS